LLYPIRDIIPFPEESQRFPPLAFFLPIFKEKSEDPAVPCGSFRFFHLQKQFLRIAGVNFQKKRANGDIILYNNICEK